MSEGLPTSQIEFTTVTLNERGEVQEQHVHTTEVDHFPPNAFGLHDMHGNLWEWCADAWHDSYDGAPTDDRVRQSTGSETHRVARGGCWHDIPAVCRSAARLKVDAHDAEEILGFRVAMG